MEKEYPLPKKFVDSYAESILRPLSLSESVTSVWVGSAGRRFVTRFIIDNIEMFDKSLKDQEKYLLVYIELLDLTEDSLSGYVRLMGSSLMDKGRERGIDLSHYSKKDIEILSEENSSYPKLIKSLNNILRIIADLGYKIVLFMGEFDELNFINSVFCNNLRSMWNQLNGSLQFVFLIKDVNLIFERKKLGEDLVENFLMNVVYVPLDPNNFTMLVEKFSKQLGYVFSDKQQKVLRQICGSHPYFLKVACRIIAKTPGDMYAVPEKEMVELLRKNYEMRAVAKRILEVQTSKARTALGEIVNGKVDSLDIEETKTLEYLGLIEKKGEYYRAFCTVFEDIVKKNVDHEQDMRESGTPLSISDSDGSILVFGKSVEEEFTPQEYEVLGMFLKDIDKVKTRDDIASLLWGGDSMEKYSDWAIDQLVSKLRKKMDHLGVAGKSIKTIRGRGYKLTL